MQRALALTSVFIFLSAPAFADNDHNLTILGTYVIPSGLQIDGVEFGGISGLDYQPETGKFIAISDDRSQKAPARFYDIDINLSKDGITGINIAAMHSLQNAQGQAWAEKTTDPEGIAFDHTYQSIFWSSEVGPALYKADLNGKLLQEFVLPDAYIPNSDGTRGIYNNQAFEGLTVSNDGKYIYVATENALIQDGPKASLDAVSPSRILQLDTVTGETIAEYIYETDKIPVKAVNNGWNDNGLSEIRALASGDFLVTERSYAEGIGFNIRLYRVSLKQATNIAGAKSIKGMDVQPVSKEEILTIKDGDFGFSHTDNIEAISFGPEIDGYQTLILATDNNFNIKEETQFYAFSLPIDFK
tara:strand:+ start:91507 stop:92580 length:1074 start_codon:yes stop_codon:yes gene_type:complete